MSRRNRVTRRHMLQTAAAAAASIGLHGRSEARPALQGSAPAASADLTGRVARYMVEARGRELPPNVLRDAKHRILDTIGAMVSGAHLLPGEAAIKFVQSQGGVAEATVLTTNIRTT